MYLKSQRRMKISNDASIRTSKEIVVPSTDDSTESDSEIDEIDELDLF